MYPAVTLTPPHLCEPLPETLRDGEEEPHFHAPGLAESLNSADGASPPPLPYTVVLDEQDKSEAHEDESCHRTRDLGGEERDLQRGGGNGGRAKEAVPVTNTELPEASRGVEACLFVFHVPKNLEL